MTESVAVYEVEVWDGAVWIVLGGRARDRERTSVTVRFGARKAAEKVASLLLHAGFDKARVTEVTADVPHPPGTTG